MINSCVRCGTKLKGFFKICGTCQMEVKVQSGEPLVVVDRDKEEDKK